MTQPVPDHHRGAARSGRFGGAARRVPDLHLIGQLADDQQPVPAAVLSRDRLPPATLIGHVHFQESIRWQDRHQPDGPGSAGRVGVLDGVGDRLGHGHLQTLPVVFHRAERVEPAGEFLAHRGQAVADGGPLQGQRRQRRVPALGGQDRHVVGVPGTGQQLHGQLADPLGPARGRTCGQYPVGGGVGGHGGQFSQGSRHRLARALDQPVAVQEHRFSRGQQLAGRSGPGTGTGTAAQGAHAGVSQIAGAPVGADGQRRRVPAGRVLQLPRTGVEQHQAQRGRPQRAVPAGVGIDLVEHHGQVRLSGQPFGQHRAELAHGGRGRHPVPHHVPDNQGHGAIGQRYRVEPVPAGGLILAGHQVAGRELHARQYRQRGGQQGLLQGGHDAPRGLIPAFRRDRTVPGHRTLTYPIGHVGLDNQNAPHTTVSGPPRGKAEIEVYLVLGTVAVRAQLYAPLAGGHRLTRCVHPIQQLEELLAGDVREHLPRWLADEVRSAGERAIGPVGRDHAMFRSFECRQQDGRALERVPHHLGVPYTPVESLAPHGHALSRRPVRLRLRGCVSFLRGVNRPVMTVAVERPDSAPPGGSLGGAESRIRQATLVVAVCFRARPAGGCRPRRRQGRRPPRPAPLAPHAASAHGRTASRCGR